MIVVTHEMGFAREVASRVVFMDEGRRRRGGPAGRGPRQPATGAHEAIPGARARALVSERERRGARIGERGASMGEPGPGGTRLRDLRSACSCACDRDRGQPGEHQQRRHARLRRHGEDGLFEDPVRPAGYSIFLRALHRSPTSSTWTIFAPAPDRHRDRGPALRDRAAHRGAGVGGRRRGRGGPALARPDLPRALDPRRDRCSRSCSPPSLYCCVRALDEPEPLWRARLRHAWIAGGRVAARTRRLGANGRVTAAPLLALWFALAIPGSWRARIARAALAPPWSRRRHPRLLRRCTRRPPATSASPTAPAGCCYGRVSPFADCTQFDAAGRRRGAVRGHPDRRAARRPTTTSGTRSRPLGEEFGPLPAEDELAREFATRGDPRPAARLRRHAVASDTAAALRPLPQRRANLGRDPVRLDEDRPPRRRRGRRRSMRSTATTTPDRRWFDRAGVARWATSRMSCASTRC